MILWTKYQLKGQGFESSEFEGPHPAHRSGEMTKTPTYRPLLVHKDTLSTIGCRTHPLQVLRMLLSSRVVSQSWGPAKFTRLYLVTFERFPRLTERRRGYEGYVVCLLAVFTPSESFYECE